MKDLGTRFLFRRVALYGACVSVVLLASSSSLRICLHLDVAQSRVIHYVSVHSRVLSWVLPDGVSPIQSILPSTKLSSASVCPLSLHPGSTLG